MHFHSRKDLCKCRLRNGGKFVAASTSLRCLAFALQQYWRATLPNFRRKRKLWIRISDLRVFARFYHKMSSVILIRGPVSWRLGTHWHFQWKYLGWCINAYLCNDALPRKSDTVGSLLRPVTMQKGFSLIPTIMPQLTWVDPQFGDLQHPGVRTFPYQNHV